MQEQFANIFSLKNNRSNPIRKINYKANKHRYRSIFLNFSRKHTEATSQYLFHVQSSLDNLKNGESILSWSAGQSKKSKI